MPSHNDPVRPIPFEVIQPKPAPGASSDAASSAANSAAQRGTPAWVLPVMGLLILLATLVVFLLPQVLEPDIDRPAAPAVAPTPAAANNAGAGEAPASADNTADGGARDSGAAADSSPWSDAQEARARREAQDVLQPLLDLQFALQSRGVEQWAGEEFNRAKALAADGDALYKNRQFADALARYQEGMTTLQNIEKSLPQTLQRLLEQARQALDTADADSAQAALATAALIEPDNKEILTLRKRAELLPQLQPLLEQAESAESAGDLKRAQTLLQQVVALDPLHARAQEALKRVSSSLSNQGFNAAMSEGYSALKAGQFDAARKAFNSAARLQPGSKEAASALQEVASAQTVQQLNSLDRQGRQQEQAEQWQKAVATYEQAQKLDRGVLFASDGLKRSKSRAELDKKLRAAIDDPLRLSDTAVAATTAQLLAEAQLVTPRGPVLEGQINRLDTALRQASIKINVTLRSDNATDVTLYKVAKLGQFEEKALSLRPGTYTALGTRDGYRDVRRSFTISHDSAPAPVTVVCSERI